LIYVHSAITATSASETFADNMFGMASIAETNVT